jgi:predicted membrane protein
MRSKIIWAFLLLAVSVALILNITGVVSFPNEKVNLWTFWPVVLIGIGLTSLFSSGSRVISLLFIFLGGYWLYGGLGYEAPKMTMELVGAIVLLLIALSILFSAVKRQSATRRASRKNSFSNVFSSGKIEYGDDVFTKGDVSAVFGGTSFDLTNTQINPDGAYLSAQVHFGGIEIFVPDGTNVITKGFIFFGGVSHDRNKKGTMTSSREGIHNGTLTVEVSGAFGGVNIVYV